MAVTTGSIEGAGTSATHWLKWAVLGLIALINLYAVTLMYIQGETIFALVFLILVTTGLYVFAAERAYVHRYIFPGVATMFIFIVFPLAYTIWIAFTNYSATNILTFERARHYHLSQTFQVEGQNYDFSLYAAGTDTYRLALSARTGERFISEPVELRIPDAKAQPPAVTAPIEIDLTVIETPPDQPPLAVRDLVRLRSVMQNVVAHLPDHSDLRMSGMRQFSATRPLFQVLPSAQGGDGSILVNQLTKERIAPDMRVGFYRQLNAEGEFTGPGIAPGFSVFVGWKNFLRVLTDPGVQGPFLQIFGWTLTFSFLSVIFTLAIGTVLASLVQWEGLAGRGLYRLLLILPYAVPAFISILVFRGLFNQNFGEINLILRGLFGIQPQWFTDPTLARTMLVMVNVWLGYPYMMLLATGYLQSIPQDHYKAAALEGAGPIRNFFSITLPQILPPFVPLLISSFAFNFNNVVLILLLTRGAPDIPGTLVPAGQTDILGSFTFRVSFQDAGQNFGIAGAISTLIFLLVGVLAYANFYALRRAANARGRG